MIDEAVYKEQQAKMLRLVTQSFCRELQNYGLDRHDMVTVSLELLDYVIDGDGRAPRTMPPEAVAWRSDEIHRAAENTFVHGEVRIEPLAAERVPVVAGWLAETDVQRNFAVRYPQEASALGRHFFEEPANQYFAICHQDAFVGLIGGEQIDPVARKLEMKKFIGEAHYRGRGIGKTATFLWLYYIFRVLHFNKVYLYSLDTNIRNLNLNSKLGFELEGILRDDVLIEGAYRDVVRMSLLHERWEDLFA